MPNHVTTQLTLSPEVAGAITRPPSEEEIARNDKENAWFIEQFEKRKAEGRTSPGEEPYQSTLPDLVVDFDLIVPSPPNKEAGDCSGTHEPGEVCWYRWNIDNWGTKWNAYSPVVERAGDLAFVQFDTAWSHPSPVIQALSEQFPDEVIEVRYADEDLGSNFGAYQIENGDILDIALG